MSASKSRIFIVGPEKMTHQMRSALTETFNELGKTVELVLAKQLSEIEFIVKDGAQADLTTDDYVIYMMDCDDNFDMVGLRADITRLQHLIKPIKKVDFFMCRAVANAKVNYPSLHVLADLARTEKIFFTTLFHDVPNKFDEQSKYCASRYRKLLLQE